MDTNKMSNDSLAAGESRLKPGHCCWTHQGWDSCGDDMWCRSASSMQRPVPALLLLSQRDVFCV